MTQKIYVANDGTEFSTKEAVMEYHTANEKFESEVAAKRKEFLQINETLSKALAAKLVFQEECNHDYVTISAHSDTGNWCKSEDSYWFEIKCKCCERSWREDQGKSNYSLYGNNPRVEVIR